MLRIGMGILLGVLITIGLFAVWQKGSSLLTPAKQEPVIERVTFTVGQLDLKEKTTYVARGVVAHVEGQEQNLRGLQTTRRTFFAAGVCEAGIDYTRYVPDWPRVEFSSDGASVIVHVPQPEHFGCRMDADNSGFAEPGGFLSRSVFAPTTQLDNKLIRDGQVELENKGKALRLVDEARKEARERITRWVKALTNGTIPNITIEFVEAKPVRRD